ncbi:MAG TPA: alpha/beta-type small acid-soluble spore protein [Ruminiclostridium sp.]|nr:alpha/beta-type small acid-soluble spore protein [Ruminiclostridium sp.]
MAGNRSSRVLVPENYKAINRFKMECAEDIGRTQFTKEYNDHYKGDVTSFQNGSEGGPIGGEMVKRMIKSFEQNMQ